MFWGVTLEVGKRYSQTVEKSFHISMAALNASNAGKDPVTVIVEVDKACYPLCTLQPTKIPQQALDYIFTEGEEVIFYTQGNEDVHLTGYLIEEASHFEYSSEEDDDGGEDSDTNAVCSKNENNTKKKRKKSSSGEEESLQNLISELDDLNKDNEDPVNIWLERSERSKRRKENPQNESNTPMSSAALFDTKGVQESSDDGDWVPQTEVKLKKKEKDVKKRQTGNAADNKKADNSTCSVNLNSSKSKKKKSKKLNKSLKLNDSESDANSDKKHNNTA